MLEANFCNVSEVTSIMMVHLFLLLWRIKQPIMEKMLTDVFLQP